METAAKSIWKVVLVKFIGLLLPPWLDWGFMGWVLVKLERVGL